MSLPGCKDVLVGGFADIPSDVPTLADLIEKKMKAMLAETLFALVLEKYNKKMRSRGGFCSP